MRVVFSSFVESDLREIGDFIAQDKPERAITFVQELRTKIAVIARNPFGYRLRPEIGSDARLATLGQYVVLFRISEETLRIERVVSGRRDLRPLFPR